MSLFKWVGLPALGDARGALVALEPPAIVPFAIRRVYYIYGTAPGVSRGFHAHRQLDQLAICIAGQCRVVLDDGQRREEAWLDDPKRGVMFEHMVWHEMHDFSADCVLLVLASEVFDETDYIRSYSEFVKAVKR